MKIKTLVIAPYPGLKELALELAAEQRDLDIIVEHGDLKEALSIVKRYENKGIDFIVSRGGTAKLIREHTMIPVVEIQVSGYDILRALTLIKDYKLKVQIIGFPNICQGVVSVAHLLHIDVPNITIHSQDEVDGAVQQAKESGVQVVLGDTITVNTATKYGLQGMMITSGRESILEAFENVRQIQRMIKPVERHLSAYQNVLDDITDGWVLFNEEGRIRSYNPAFVKLLNVSTELFDASLYHILPGLSGTLEQKNMASNKEEPFTIEYFALDHTTFQLTGGLFSDMQERLYYLIFRQSAPERDERSVQVRTSNQVTTSFAQIIDNSPIMKKTVQQAKELIHSAKPILIYGAKGTGKKLIATAIHRELDVQLRELIEITIPDQPLPQEALIAIQKVIDKYTSVTLLLKGLEHLDVHEQQDILKIIKQEDQPRIRTILLFDADPQQLITQGDLPEAIIHVTDHVLRIPALKERKEDLDEYIRLFIGIYNSKYGKQVVGLRAEALDRLLQHEWQENISELNTLIEKLVRTAQGYYIELADLDHVLQDAALSSGKEQPINLSKTLAEIEQDIIQYVLKEENMNQTKAAKRLGINRSTLWRKLNEREELS